MSPKEIYVKIQIDKDPDTNNLQIVTQFDKNAPNFSHDQDHICWIPTSEELAFMNEAFTMVQNHKKQ